MPASPSHVFDLMQSVVPADREPIDRCVESPTLNLILRGCTPITWTTLRQPKRRVWNVGTFTYMADGLEASKVLIQNEVVVLNIDLAGPKLNALLQDDSLASQLDQLPKHLIGEDGQIFSLANCLREERLSGGLGGRLYDESLSLALFSYLVTRYSTRTTRDKPIDVSARKIRLLQEYIEGNISNDLSLCELGAVVNLGARQLSKSFRKAVGMSPHQYVMNVRVNRAKAALQSKVPVTEIAYALGFSSAGHFSTTFGKLVGVSPTKFAKGG